MKIEFNLIAICSFSISILFKVILASASTLEEFDDDFCVVNLPKKEFNIDAINENKNAHEYDFDNSIKLLNTQNIFDAFFECNLEKIKKLMETDDFDVELKNDYGQTLLGEASYFGYIDVVDNLIKKGANLNEIFNNEYTPLRYAIISENVDLIKLLIKSGADVNYKSGTGGSALQDACRKKNVKLIKLLLENGADDSGVFNFAGAFSENYFQVRNFIKKFKLLKRLKLSANSKKSMHKRNLIGNLSDLIETYEH